MQSQRDDRETDKVASFTFTDEISAAQQAVDDEQEGEVVVQGALVTRRRLERPGPALDGAREQVHNDQDVDLETRLVVHVDGDHW